MAGLRGKAQQKAAEEVVEVVAPVEETEVAPKVQVAEAPKTQPNVRVKPNADIRTYIGNQWYTFKAGVQTNVPQQVKDVLAKAGYLDAL